VDESLLDEAARAMEGFSGREIAKFMASVQAGVYGSAQATLTPELFR
jgi:ATPase family AAA domain-containing protein 3A/B